MKNLGLYTNNVSILVASDKEEERQFISNTMELHGFQVMQAIDGGTAIKVLEERAVDLVIFAYDMKPHTGLELAKHILVNKYKIGMIMVVKDTTTDILLEAGKFEINQVLRRPLDPDRIAAATRRVLRIYGKNPDSLSDGAEPKYTPMELMERAIALGAQNAKSKMGGPFGAVVADRDGHILGEGVNGVTSRCDPIAHAEVMAIRSATERLRKPRLDDCDIYCSSEPTMVAQALIISTGIRKVHYGLTHEEIGAVRAHEDGILGEMSKPLNLRIVPFEKIGHAMALKMFEEWQAQTEKVSD